MSAPSTSISCAPSPRGLSVALGLQPEPHSPYNVVGWDATATLERLVRKDEHGDPSPVEGWLLAADGRLDHGTPWLRIIYSRSEERPREVKVGGNLTTEIAFGEPGIPAADFSKIAEAVRTILNAFLADFPETQFTE